jgi:hypothetical protein
MRGHCWSLQSFSGLPPQPHELHCTMRLFWSGQQLLRGDSFLDLSFCHEAGRQPFQYYCTITSDP